MGGAAGYETTRTRVTSSAKRSLIRGEFVAHADSMRVDAVRMRTTRPRIMSA